jgi:hypothetical protein
MSNLYNFFDTISNHSEGLDEELRITEQDIEKAKIINKPIVDKNLEKLEINLQLTKEQLDIISQALEIYTRLGVFQFGSSILPSVQDDSNFSYSLNKSKILTLLKQVRNLLIETNPDFKSYAHDMSDWSINLNDDCVSKDIKLAGELHYAIEHFKYKYNSGKVEYSQVLNKLTNEPNMNISIE